VEPEAGASKPARCEAVVALGTLELREFAVQCLRWSAETNDPGQRDLIARVAKDWINTASTLDRRLDDGFILVGDLRRKLD
jgi:hypothetical protein